MFDRFWNPQCWLSKTSETTCFFSYVAKPKKYARYAVSLLRLCRGRVIDERVAPSAHCRLNDEGERRANEEAAVEEADHQRAGAAPLRKRHGLGRVHEGARGEPAVGE